MNGMVFAFILAQLVFLLPAYPKVNRTPGQGVAFRFGAFCVVAFGLVAGAGIAWRVAKAGPKVASSEGCDRVACGCGREEVQHGQ